MSLINEALKEARHEVAQNDSRRGGSLYPRVPRHGPRRRRRVGWLALAAVLLVASVAGGAAWLIGRGAATPVGAPIPAAARFDLGTGPASEPIRATEAAQLEPPPPTSVTSPESEVSAAAQSDVAARIPPPDELSATDEAAAPAAPEDAARGATHPASPSPATVGGETGPVPLLPDSVTGEPATYHREALLGDGKRVTLGGIAWSPSQPVALLNGRVMGIGERVEGYTLRQVHRREVHLARADAVIIITLE